MGYKIGIDVGGTFTDMVLMHRDEVVMTGKAPTKQEDLLQTVLATLEDIKPSIFSSIDLITVSTTLVTNAILQNHLSEVELILFPGSGMRLSAYAWPIPFYTLTGELDYRGREVRPPSLKEWEQLVKDLREKKTNNLVAIVSKFSHRNHIFEEQLANYLKKELPKLEIALGSHWGQANFYRRSLTTYLNLASQRLYLDFSRQLEKALRSRGCQAPIQVLKADGGVLPIGKIRPVESIYSGPAASVLGALAQNPEEGSYIVVDIGGTTTDIGLVLSGKPLMSSRGAQIGSYLTNVRSLAVRSVPIGGDSTVSNHEGDLKLADSRLGHSYCLGGPNPTPTDAMCFLGLIDYGDHRKAEEAIASLLPADQQNMGMIKKTAEAIVTQMADKISRSIEQLLLEWQEEPAYKVWEVLHHQHNSKFSIQLSGGGAPGIAHALEERMACKTVLMNLSSVSNAIGAALAKPTFSWTLNLDTYLARYSIEETGKQGEWLGAKKPYKEAEKFLYDLAFQEAKQMGIESYTLQQEPFDYFPLVENNRTVGQIIRGSVHIPPGVSQLKKGRAKNE